MNRNRRAPLRPRRLDDIHDQRGQTADQQHAAGRQRRARHARDDRGERHHGENRQREPPVVDEQAGELAQQAHDRRHGSASTAGRRSALTAASAASRNSTAIAGMARSSPGQGTPRPSPTPNTPKPATLTPTPTLTLFSRPPP